jgi:uncharacterized protein involved in outer membrane biogenesis
VRVAKWTAGVVAALLLAAVLFLFFGLNLLKGPISRAVSEATGRELVIEGDLEAVPSWVHPRLRAEKVRFANPEWAAEKHLFTADLVEATVSLLPLLRGRVVVPEVHLQGAELNLELDAEGRKSWVLGDSEEQKQESRFFIRRLTVDDGHLRYDDAGRRIHLSTRLRSDDTGIDIKASGKYRGENLTGTGHAGHILSLRDESTEFPLSAEVKIGATTLKVDGKATGIVGLERFDTSFHLRGASMSQLYGILNVAFPETKPYSTSGRLIRDGTLVRYEKFTGKVGESDLSGTLQVDTGGERPMMQGNLTSKVMDLGDLGVVVGTNQPRKDGVLPDSPFDPARWDSVDADVTIKAGTIKRPEQLPIEDLSVRIQMKDRILTLNPLAFGIAGGKLAGPVMLDGTRETIRANVKMRVQDLKLARLFPTIEQNQTSVGNLSGLVELTGAGNSVGKMLASANGKIGVFMDGGRISRFMMELAALDLWDAAKVKLEGDRPVEIRCAIADFAAKDGTLQANAFVFDTSVVLIEGGGTVDLKSEALNLKLNPKPKDNSLASLNSPLYVRGTFSDPAISPDVGKLAAKGLGAIVLGIVNPLLAVLPLFKEGKGEDSNCGRLLAEVKAPAKAATAKPPPSSASGSSRPPPR